MTACILATKIINHLMPDDSRKQSDIDKDEDDADVVVGIVSKQLEPSLKPNLAAPSDNYEYVVSRNNPVVKALIQNRKKFDPSWTQAAESVFSDAHPFTPVRRNRSQETLQTQNKEQIASRSSSESRCSSPKNKTKGEVVASRETNKRLSKISKDLIEVERKKRKETVSEGEKENLKTQWKNSPPVTDNKLESPKSCDERKPVTKKKRVSLSMSRHRHSAYINSERLLNLKIKVDAAIREHKVYSMTGHYGSVRKALKQRGWVEKIDSDIKGRRRSHKFEDTDEASFYISGKHDHGGNKEHGSEQCEAEIVNRMLRNIPEDLCWLSKPYPYCWKDINKCDMVNRLPKAYFSNKVGLANCLAHMQWYFEDGVCSTQFPRTYNISLRDEYDAFQEDFRLTACISTLKWVTSNYKMGGEASVRCPDGKVDLNVIEFAQKRCAEYIKTREHDDIDVEIAQTWDHQWDHFLTQYYKLVNEGHVLREAKEDPPIMAIVSNAQTTINCLLPYWPQMEIEGVNNWWIVKPGGRCCGNGILIRNHLDQIMGIVSPTITRETRYVVQKYIERPLLIYNTKFDIRQWFLVTNVYPLTIWMYKESYLRFCSTTFSLKSTHESIHLCNNAVQRRYKNGKRDRSLPDENMWDCYTFQTYLKTIGYPTVWDDVIYPGMRESFVGALLASQDNMERRRNCFELYGADFMVSEQITDGPWLIEINSNPAMDSSTSVTARMCPQVLEDIVKVVIDRRNDRNAPTGAFELAFKQNCPPIPPYLGMSLSIRGKKIYKSVTESKKPRRPNYQQQGSDSDESTSSSEDENIVQKRCSTDFMQPIKTLREEIRRMGETRSRDDLLCVRNDVLSDSAAETDTSRGSTDRRMALEGKEIELKRKKKRKRYRNINRTEIKNKFKAVVEKKPVIKKKEEEPAKKPIVEKKPEVVRKLDVVRGQNIAKLFEKQEEEDRKFLVKSQENLDIYKDYIFSGQCLDEYKSTNKNSHEVLEKLFQKEMAKIINDDSKEFNETLQNENSGQNAAHGPIIITGLWEPLLSKTEEPQDTDQVRETEMELLRVDRSQFYRAHSTSSLNLDSDKNCSTSAGDLSDFEIADSTRSSSRSYLARNSDLDLRYEKMLKQIEGSNRLKYKRSEGDFTKALSITAPDLLVKERSRPNRWQTTKTSMEYFRDWKFKIDETRRNCEDMLTKLRHFKETNSKLKFQDVLQRRIEEEARLIRKMKRIRGNRLQTKSDDSEMREQGAKRRESFNKENSSKLLAEKRTTKEEFPLAISTASGAVLNVSDVLPKIKLRNRPLLPNGVSGHSRNVEQRPDKLILPKNALKKETAYN